MVTRRRTRRQWDALKPSYRARLQRNGYGVAQYLAGESATRARGHAKTPEHPDRYKRKPAEYAEYRRKRGLALDTRWREAYEHLRSLLITALINHDIDRYDDARVMESMRNGGPVLWTTALELDLLTLQDLASEQGSGSYINPFWYH